MVPVIISTVPEKGSSDIALREPLKLTFAAPIASGTVTNDNIKLENTNNGHDVPLTLTYNSDTYEISIVPAEADAYTNSETQVKNYLIGLVSYRLVVSDIASPLGESMQDVFVLDFTTMQDSITSVVTEPEIQTVFGITNQYPKADSYGTTPTVIKIKFSSDILITSITGTSIIVTSDTVEDINDIGFVDYATVAGAVAIDNSNAKILTFTPTAAFTDNTKYTVIVQGVSSATETIEPYMYTFYSKMSPMYSTVQAIQSKYTSVAEIIKGMDPLDVLEIIKDNSNLAKWIAEQAENTDNIDWDTPDRCVSEYVKTKTRYDILMDKYVQLAGNGQSKNLGDLQITYNFSLSDLLDLIDKLKDEYLKWEEMLKGVSSGRATLGIFTKGESVDDDPDYKDRGMTDWDGNTSW